MENSREILTLETLLDTKPTTEALKSRKLHSDLVDFHFADLKVAHRGFKDLVREAKYDLGQIALVTFLQAKVHEKPYVLLPAVVIARGQHRILYYNPERGELKPGDLHGKRIGVRSYTQTTGAWLRGILQEDYGVDPTRCKWITMEDAHVAEYQDPPWVERAPEEKQLQQMLLNGEIDAAILEGSTVPDPRLKRIFSSSEEAEKEWSARNGGSPINHMVVVKSSLSREHPDVVREVYRLLLGSRNAAPASNDPSALRFGVEATRRSLEKMIEYAVRQELIPHPMKVDDLYDDVTRSFR